MKKTKKKSVKGKRSRARAVKDLSVSESRPVKGGATISGASGKSKFVIDF